MAALGAQLAWPQKAELPLVKGATGALRDPATGRFVANPNRAARVPRSGVHGNSRLSDAETFL